MTTFLETPAVEGTTFPDYASHADLVRAWYSANYGIELKSLTREAWALAGTFPDESHPVTEAGAPDFARFSGKEHLLDYVRTTARWDLEIVHLFRALPAGTDLDFTALLIARCSDRPSNVAAALMISEACINIAAIRSGSDPTRSLRKLAARHSVSAN